VPDSSAESAGAQAQAVATAAAPTAAGVPSEVLLVERMSVRYDSYQDRIALDIADQAGALARLWLTRRGANVLVQTTVSRVEAFVAARIAAQDVDPSAAKPMRESALAAQQLTARLTQRKAQAVDVPAGTTQHLVTAINMTTHPHRIQIDFRSGDTTPAQVLLQSAELFQWLAAVQRQYLKAGWSLEAWPGWFTQHLQNR
jgi:hypothetical protein